MSGLVYRHPHPAGRLCIFFTGEPIPAGIGVAFAVCEADVRTAGVSGVLVVPVRFLGQNVECLVDTGATYTARRHCTCILGEIS